MSKMSASTSDMLRYHYCRSGSDESGEGLSLSLGISLYRGSLYRGYTVVLFFKIDEELQVFGEQYPRRPDTIIRAAAITTKEN